MEILFDSLKEAILSFKGAWQVFTQIWFLILPAPFYYLFKYAWMKHIRKRYAMSIEWVLLEIVPPRDIEKSPKPMESIFEGMAGVMKGFTPVEEFIDGMLPVSFSLEIVSIGGSVHFFIRTPKSFRNLVEANVYAQYPNAEIIETPDYINNVPKLLPNKEWDLWGVDFEFSRPDPYPIKTYKKFEEDITGTMDDPLSSVVENMGKIPPDQQIWFQYVIVPEPEKYYEKGKEIIDELAGKKKKEKKSFIGTVFKDLVDIIKNIIPAIYRPIEFESKAEEKKDEAPIEFRLSSGEKETLKAVEANVSRYFFKTKMRVVYLGKRENFSRSVVSSFVGSLKQFSDFHLNSFVPNDASKTYANFVFIDSRLRWRQRKILKRYRDRDLDGVKIYLSTEELATVFHMPDMYVVAPSIRKTDFKRGGAPSNLPVG